MASPTPMDTSDNPQQSQVQVKFVTRNPEISISTAPILVPTTLKRFGLSQVVNHLLDTPKPIPFDFLVDGAFLRSTLDAYIALNGLSSESVITLEYVRASVPPKFLSSFQHDDWVSSVSSSTQAGSQHIILSGSYDGIARIWNLSGQVIGEGAGHTAAIKAAKWWKPSAFVTGGIDRALRMWSYEPEDQTVDCIAEYIGHKSTIEDLAIHAATKRIISASSDGTVGVWSTSPKDLPPAPEVAAIRTKKRKISRPTAPQYGALASLSGHTSPVSGVSFAPQDATVAYSVSWDHTIRTWDLTTMALVDTRTTKHPLLSICPLQTLSLLACGSSARHITLHDPRASASGVSTATLHGHTNAVVALSASRDNEWQMVSGSHDGTVRVWDVRASHSGNLFTIYREGRSEKGGEKVFDVEWTESGIVAGGDDKKIQINAMPSTGEETAAAAVVLEDRGRGKL